MECLQAEELKDYAKQLYLHNDALSSQILMMNKKLVRNFVSKTHLKNKLKNVIMEQSFPEVANFFKEAYKIGTFDSISTLLNLLFDTCKFCCLLINVVVRVKENDTQQTPNYYMRCN